MFKADWEKGKPSSSLSLKDIKSMVGLARPLDSFVSCQQISQGCANLNYKIQLEEPPQNCILRLYLRDRDAAYREQKLGDLLKGRLPVPKSYFIGTYGEYQFALTEFMQGISLRGLLQSDDQYDLGAVMHRVGLHLAKLSDHTFHRAGFFDRDLHPSGQGGRDDLLTYAKTLFQNAQLLDVLGKKVVSQMDQALGNHSEYLPDGLEKRLVHGDFDPANLLVDQGSLGWDLSGILDFEFAFSGSSLWDVANMLRYAHQMPEIYAQSFIEGYKDGDGRLPEGWQVSIRLLNMLSLLDCLSRVTPQTHPNRCQDIVELINHNLHGLKVL